MRWVAKWLGILGILFLCAGVQAQTATTRPTDSVKLAVLPFEVVGDSQNAWIGRAIQEGISAGVHGESNLSTINLAGTSSSDSESSRPADLSRLASAEFVVSGTVQVVDQQMRITGLIQHISDGTIVGNLHLDGSIRDLFTLEDSLSHKIVRVISPPVTHKPVARPQIELRGPVTAYQSKYFDDNFAIATQTPERFRTEYDRYYYQPSSDCYFGCGYGYGYGLGVCGYGIGYGFGVGGGWNLRPAAPLSGW